MTITLDTTHPTGPAGPGPSGPAGPTPGGPPPPKATQPDPPWPTEPPPGPPMPRATQPGDPPTIPPFPPPPKRKANAAGRCGICRRPWFACVEAIRCPDCVSAVRLLVSSAMRGETAARHCPHVGASLRDRAEAWAQGFLNAVAGTSPVAGHGPTSPGVGDAVAPPGSGCATARAEALDDTGASAR